MRALRHNGRKCGEHSRTDTDNCYITHTVCMLKITYIECPSSDFKFMFQLMTGALLRTAGFQTLKIRTKGLLEHLEALISHISRNLC